MATPTIGPLAQINGERGELGRLLLEALFPAPAFREDVERVCADITLAVYPALMKQLVSAVEHGMIRTSAQPLLVEATPFQCHVTGLDGDEIVRRVQASARRRGGSARGVA